MSIESVAIALHHSQAAGTAKLVLIGIANHDGDGGAWPSIATLAKYAGGKDRSSIQRAIAKLEQLGEVRRIVMGGGDETTPDHRRPNRYKFLLECPPHCDRTSNHRDARKPLIRLHDDESTGAALARPQEIHRGRTGAARGAALARPEPSINSHQDLNEIALDPAARARETCVAGHNLITVDGHKYCEIACRADYEAREKELTEAVSS